MLSSTVNTPNKSLYKIVNKVNYSILAGWTLTGASGQSCNGVSGWKH